MLYSNELYHYGRLGMKWGQHRFHDKYGAMTRAGQIRSRELSSEHKRLSSIRTLSKRGEQRLSEVEKEYEILTGKQIGNELIPAVRPKRVQDMTNEELSAYNTRKQLETTYQTYQPKVQISKGKQFTQTVVSKVIAPVAIDIGKKYISKVAMEKLNIKATAK